MVIPFPDLDAYVILIANTALNWNKILKLIYRITKEGYYKLMNWKFGCFDECK